MLGSNWKAKIPNRKVMKDSGMSVRGLPRQLLNIDGALDQKINPLLILIFNTSKFEVDLNASMVEWSSLLK